MDTGEKGSEIELEQEQAQDDDFLSSASTVSRSETPEDIHISTISIPLAVSIATVFEELSDRLAVVGHTLPTQAVDARTRDSIDFSLMYNMPTLHETITSEKGDQDDWVVHQHYASHIPRRLEYIVDPTLLNRQSATDIMKRSGVKCITQAEKTQKLRVQIQLMANVVVSELVVDATFDSLRQQIEMENKEKAAKEEEYKKINMYKHYIQNIKAEIRETRRQKEEQAALQQIDIHNITDLFLEQDIRSLLEDNFVKKYGAARVGAMKRANNSIENQTTEELRRITTKVQLERNVHDDMMRVIEQKLHETSVLYDSVVEKYEKDFYRVNLELETLIKARKRDLNRIAWLQRRIVDYERIVFDNRRIKKKETDKIQKKIMENKKAVKIQAWWRGTMVRKWKGPFKELFTMLYQLRAMKKEAKANKKGRPKPKK